MSNINSIPEPTPDLTSLTTTVRALKEIVEGLMGTRPGRIGRAPRLFVQPTPPTGPTALVSAYDLWIASGSSTLYYFDGRLWRDLTTAGNSAGGSGGISPSGGFVLDDGVDGGPGGFVFDDGST